MHIKNTIEIIEGNNYNWGCSVQYGSPINFIQEVNKPTLHANIGNRIIRAQELEMSEGVVGESASSISIVSHNVLQS